MKFEANKPYELFGYKVILVEGIGSPWFKIYKGGFYFNISMSIDENFLRLMGGTESRKLELLFRDLDNFAKSCRIESQDDGEGWQD